ncbi:MAG: hypothetical protein WDO18_10090 [Acidobacteriota bacterium]
MAAFASLTAAYERIHTPALMSDAAKAYLNSLTPEQRAKTVYPFDDAERFELALHSCRRPQGRRAA